MLIYLYFAHNDLPTSPRFEVYLGFKFECIFMLMFFQNNEHYVFVMSGRIGHASKKNFPLSDPLKYFKYQCSTLPLHVCLSVCLSVHLWMLSWFVKLCYFALHSLFFEIQTWNLFQWYIATFWTFSYLNMYSLKVFLQVQLNLQTSTKVFINL